MNDNNIDVAKLLNPFYERHADKFLKNAEMLSDTKDNVSRSEVSVYTAKVNIILIFYKIYCLFDFLTFRQIWQSSE